MKTTTIDLASPIMGHGEPISRVVIKEPTGRDYFALGEPAVGARNPDGTTYWVENVEVIEKYIEACVSEPSSGILLGQLCLADAMRVKDAVLDFFGAARRNISPSSATP